MKTFTRLTATIADSTPPAPTPLSPSHTQSQKGFQRRIRFTKTNLILQANNGVSAAIPIAEIWALAEANEPLFKTPQPLTSS